MSFRITPVIKITLFYTAGLIFSYLLPDNIFSFLILSIIISSIFMFLKIRAKKNYFYSFILLFGFLIGWHSASTTVLNPLKKHYNKNSIIYGKILEYQKPLRKYNKVLFKVLKINNKNISARINLLTKKRIRLKKNSYLLIKTKIKQPKGAANFGEINYGLYYKRYKIYGYAYILKKYQIKKIIQPSTLSIYYIAETIRADIKKFIRKNYSLHQINFLNAILLGERTLLNKKIKSIFINTGTVHILAISGLHIGIITIIFLSLFQLFFKDKKSSYILTLIIIILYNFIVGYKVSIVRSTIMFSSMLLTRLLDRDKNYLNALSFSALLILLFNPTDINRISFQLSFLATLGVILFTTNISEFILNKLNIKNKILVYLINIISASIASQILIIPVLIYYFHKLAYISIIANLIAIPLITIILFLTILAYMFFHILPILSAVLSSLNNLLIAVMIFSLNLLTIVKPLYLSILKPLSIFLYYSIITILILPIKNIKYKTASVSLIFLFLFVTFIPSSTNIEINKNTEIIIFNIKGRSIFIKTPGNHRILIDAGYYSDAIHHIIPYLKRNNIKKIDKVILTSDAKYRSEGIVNILKKFKVKHYYDAGYPSSSLRYQRIMELITSRRIHYNIIREKNKINIDGVKIKILSPQKILYKNYNHQKETGENSLCLKISFKTFSILFIGDIHSRQINSLIHKHSIELDSIILNLSSLNFTDIENLLTYASPKIITINKYFNRMEQSKFLNLKNLLKKFKIKYISTQQRGAIKIIIYPDGRYKYITTY